MCSLGVSVDVTLAAALPHGPCSPRSTRRCRAPGRRPRLPVERIDAFVEVAGPVAEYRHEPVGEAAEAIARYVARLVPDGATLQIGLGRVPNEMLHAPVAAGATCGCTATSSPTAWSTCSTAAPSARAGHRRGLDGGRDAAPVRPAHGPQVDFQPLEQLAHPVALTRLERLVSVTQAFAVDLTGQVCADSDDGELYGGVASQPLMHWAAAHSHRRPRRRLPVDDLPGRTARGSGRRCWPDEAVTIPRADVHYVVDRVRHGLPVRPVVARARRGADRARAPLGARARCSPRRWSAASSRRAAAALARRLPARGGADGARCATAARCSCGRPAPATPRSCRTSSTGCRRRTCTPASSAT